MERFAVPVEGIIVGLVAALLGFALWLVARWVGGRFDSSDRESSIASTARQVVVLVLVAIPLLAPVALMPTTADPLLQRIGQTMAEPSSQHLFGTDHLGRDIYTRVVFAWRDTVYAGFAIGVVLFGLGVFWRLITPFNRSLLALEPILERMPPAVIFFGLWGAITGLTDDTATIRTIAIASGVVLVPTALGLARRVALQAMPAVFAGLVLLGTLLVIGWSVVIAQLGLLAPPLSNFGEMLWGGRDWMNEAPWMVEYPAAVLTGVVILSLVALTALSRCYGISRELIRLRG